MKPSEECLRDVMKYIYISLDHRRYVSTAAIPIHRDRIKYSFNDIKQVVDYILQNDFVIYSSANHGNNFITDITDKGMEYINLEEMPDYF